jgi:hypothetical protein
MSSNRNFGIVFFIVFLILAIYPLSANETLDFKFLFLSLVFLILGLINSNVLSPLNKFWHKFGIILGVIFSPIIMAMIFFLIVTPIGLLLKIFRKDILNLKFNKKKTYWIENKNANHSMKKQF